MSNNQNELTRRVFLGVGALTVGATLAAYFGYRQGMESLIPTEIHVPTI